MILALALVLFIGFSIGIVTSSVIFANACAGKFDKEIIKIIRKCEKEQRK